MILLVCIAAFSWQAYTYAIVQDDAYITLSYAKNLAGGEGLVFNPGERVEGYTNFLWTLILTLPHLVDLDPIFMARALGWLCSAATFVVLLLFGMRQQQLIGARQPLSPTTERAPHRLWPLLLPAPILLAACGAFAFWALSGMETALFTLLITAGAYSYQRELHRGCHAREIDDNNPRNPNAPHLQRNSDKHHQRTAWLFALAALTRPEGWLFFGLTALHRLVNHLTQRHLHAREFLRWAAPALGLFVAHFAFRYFYYGHLLPNTFYAKTGAREVLLHYGWAYSRDFLVDYGFYGLALIVPLLLLFVRADRKVQTWRSYSALLISSNALYITAIGGDVLDAFRFYLPILPLIYLSLQDGLTQLWQRFAPQRPALFVALFLIPSAFFTYALPQGRLDYAQRSMHAHNARLYKLAECINQSPGQDLIIATGAIGIPKYYTRARVIDLIGLTDSTIARHPVRVAGLYSPSILRQQNARYVLDRRPDFIGFITGIKPQTLAEKALFLQRRFRRDYYLSFCSDDAPIYARKPDASTASTDETFADPTFVEDYIAGLNAESSNPSAAIKHYARALENGPADFAEPLLWLGAIHHERGEGDQARPYLQRAIERDPYTAWAYAYLAIADIAKGENLKNALDRARLAAQLTPRSHFSNYIYGSALLRNGDSDNAKRYLRRAIELGGHSTPQARFLLGLATYQSGDIETARQLWQIVLKEQPDHEMARRNLDALKAQ